MTDFEFNEMGEVNTSPTGLPNTYSYLPPQIRELVSQRPGTAHDFFQAAALVRAIGQALPPQMTIAKLTLADADILDAEGEVMMAKARRWELEHDKGDSLGGWDEDLIED